MRIFLSLLLLTALLGAVSLAPAQSANDKAAAEALYQRGVKLTEAGNYDEACKQFEASQRLDPGLGTQLYLADCYERTGKIASAWAMFHEAESIAQGRGDTERAQIARQRANTLEPKLAKLFIKVSPSATAGLEVRRNGSVIPRESWGQALPVDPGSHTIEVSAPGKQAWARTVEVAGSGATTEVNVPALEDAPEPAPATVPVSSPPETQPGSVSPDPDEEPRSGGQGQRLAAFVTGGVGLAGLVVGSIFGLRAKAKNDDSLEQCPNSPNLCTAQGVKLREEAQSAATVATVGMVIGGAALATGIVLYLTAPSPDETARSLQLRTVSNGSGANMQLRGTW